MKSKLIGLILKSLLKEYDSGACDDLDKSLESELFSLLELCYSIITSKLDKTLTTELASIYLNVTRQTLNNYVKQGKIHPTKQLGGVLQYSIKELNKLKKHG